MILGRFMCNKGYLVLIELCRVGAESIFYGFGRQGPTPSLLDTINLTHYCRLTAMGVLSDSRGELSGLNVLRFRHVQTHIYVPINWLL